MGLCELVSRFLPSDFAIKEERWGIDQKAFEEGKRRDDLFGPLRGETEEDEGSESSSKTSAKLKIHKDPSLISIAITRLLFEHPPQDAVEGVTHDALFSMFELCCGASGLRKRNTIIRRASNLLVATVASSVTLGISPIAKVISCIIVASEDPDDVDEDWSMTPSYSLPIGLIHITGFLGTEAHLHAGIEAVRRLNAICNPIARRGQRLSSSRYYFSSPQSGGGYNLRDRESAPPPPPRKGSYK